MAAPQPGPSGILLIDKPQGWTSHDVVAKVRRICRQKRTGHTGTLDPMATGLLVVCLGNATRMVEFMTAHSKRYTGEITLGATTTTDDAEGEAIASAPVPDDLAARLPTVLPAFVGDIQQLPPAFSALKVGGQRAYDVARKGEAPALQARPVRIERLSVQIAGPDRLVIDVECGAGTYIRSLARDIGAALGCGGHLSGLRRQRVGEHSVAQAVTLDELAAIAEAGRLDELLLPSDEGVRDLPVAIVREERARALRNGLTHHVPAAVDVAPVRVYDPAGDLVGIGAVSGGVLHCSKVMAGL